MTTTPTNSTVSAEQAIADVHAICDGLADVHTEKVPAMHRLFAFIAQHSTEPSPATCRVATVMCDPFLPDGLPWFYMADFLRFGPNDLPIYKTRDPIESPPTHYAPDLRPTDPRTEQPG
jgi:hypothetical protein